MDHKVEGPKVEYRPLTPEEEAMAAVREAILADADAEPEVYDTRTGQPAAPGSSAGWREHLATKTGF